MKRLALLSFLLLAACDAGGEGRVRVHVSGEGPAKTGYPFDDGADVIAFVDGWTLTYDHVLVSLGGFSLEAGEHRSAGVVVDPVVADLHLGDPIAWQLEGVGAGRWDRLSFDLAPPPADARLLEGVQASDVERMRAGGFALLVEGEAVNGGTTIPFSFGIPDPVRAYDCENGVDGTEGIVVGTNAVEDVELTIHLDHLFLDSIAAPEPAMRFEPFAALAGADGTLTLDDLAGTAVTDVRDRDGDFILVDGGVLVLDPGPFALDASRSIASYVRANATTVGHLNGEGHCRYRVGPVPP